MSQPTIGNVLNVKKFTFHNSYDRHINEKQCNSCQPKLVCPGRKFQHIMNSSEKVFYGGNMQVSWKACRWIECQSELIGRHIHHILCGHGGERCVVIDKNEILVDGFDSETGTIYQFYRCKWHGCPCLGIANDKYHRTMNLENQIRSLGHNMVSIWECENSEFSKNTSSENSFPILTT